MRLLLLLLLSRVSRGLCATPWTAAYQAPPSTGFSRQEYWSGSPVPSPCMRRPFQTVHGVLKARILKWFAILFSRDHVLSELSTMTRLSWVALHGMVHSFIELDKAVKTNQSDHLDHRLV